MDHPCKALQAGLARRQQGAVHIWSRHHNITVSAPQCIPQRPGGGDLLNMQQLLPPEACWLCQRELLYVESLSPAQACLPDRADQQCSDCSQNMYHAVCRQLFVIAVSGSEWQRSLEFSRCKRAILSLSSMCLVLQQRRERHQHLLKMFRNPGCVHVKACADGVLA